MPPGHPESKMAEPPKLTRIKPAWSDVKAKVDEFDEAGLIQLVAELCSFRKGNQSFLHARVSPGQNSLDDFRKKVVNGWNVEDSSATNSDALCYRVSKFLRIPDHLCRGDALLQTLFLLTLIRNNEVCRARIMPVGQLM
jgi:hypothetical protein